MNLGLALTTIEWIGSILALVGSGLLASNTKLSVWGFAVYLVSNCCWIAYAIATNAHGMLFMQCGFLATSIFGIYRWNFPKHRAASCTASVDGIGNKAIEYEIDLPVGRSAPSI